MQWNVDWSVRWNLIVRIFSCQTLSVLESLLNAENLIVRSMSHPTMDLHPTLLMRFETAIPTTKKPRLFLAHQRRPVAESQKMVRLRIEKILHHWKFR